MLLVDIENAEAVSALVTAMLPELPEPKKRAVVERNGQLFRLIALS